jgi:predicted branched-subunit amino acid permease
MMIGRSIGPAGVAIAVPLCLFAMVAPGSATRDEHVVLVVAGVLAWVGSPLPAGTGMLLAIASGAAVGVLAESRRGRP